ncbi:MAG TPA: hypothetical protein VK541_13065 [Pedobacter sp.]|uniref:hypothetical protein n=1 Tax=Pedobacter sp. TaxID=1411316 RepID=UPI002B85841D|nr:hypothetical protein [Pedobacter sp.]HMI03412.1 hypothetical protein [Pedobacter sp.]
MTNRFIKLVTVLLLAFAQTGYAEIKLPKGKAAYIVAVPKTALEKRIVTRLSDYLTKVLNVQPRVVSSLKSVPGKVPAILLFSNDLEPFLGVTAPKDSPEAFALQTRTSGVHPLIIATGNTENGLKRAVQHLILKSEQRSSGLVIPDLKVSESPWISKREWTLCPWSPTLVRGVFTNPDADKRLNVWMYSNSQIVNYVDMFDSFGFSGCQLMETVANYSILGSAEAFRGRLKTFAKSLQENGQDVSLWVWAAQFNDYGWTDPSVAYKPAKGKTAFDDPDVRATFEKYYKGYAEMAPYVDMLITHYYDPGSLENRADVFKYMRLLLDKFRAKNPDVKLGVDFWASGSDADYMQQLIDNGFGDATLLESSIPHAYAPGKREELHVQAKQRNIKMGVWGWYTTEMETDQVPTMYVNTKVLKHFYNQMKDGVSKIQPITYWSEMEAYHLCNIFTMYSSAQLLWNPDRDPDEILREISEGIWGPRNAPAILEALKLIQDVRSGPTWDTYWWTMPEHRLGTADPRQDISRADRVLAGLEKMKTDTSYVSKFPLPFPPETFVELMIPHIRQIRQFAGSRLDIAAIRKAAASGTSKEMLTGMIVKAWNPIPEYNTWIGTWGQPEARTQEKLFSDLAKELDIAVAAPAWTRWRDANRQLQGFQKVQRAHRTPWKFKSDPLEVYKWPPAADDERAVWREFHWTPQKGADRLKLLLENGYLEKAGEHMYQLSNWKDYSVK